MNNPIPKLRKCINCGIGTDDGFPRDAHEENYCYICIMRGKAIQYKPEKVYLVYYNGWDYYIPDLMAVKSTKEKADAYISELVAKETWNVDDFYVNEWDLL